ncbi:TetR/AcrR family transcriptional regulator [Amycolatopsis sp. K13G38]|uniref:TetR/AcrR family transcriptional regulator n=1 Tax=Amycolatopsis acididurans TaxID=2724524 RepID=A0ABX1IVQ2_9PSEU|nr:TetR/AcrR family transcriptional regulator [Amycolatopsis acididurans]NKQ51281.1 TetR/AcrR family transcriptional regulator [Amycolatopsis acididurans]
MTERRSRRRGEELERAILDAAWEELKASGYASLTMEAVAARAGTSKPVIYRRWPTRAELVIAAWHREMPTRPVAPDTGSLRGDLLALFTRVTKRADSIMSESIAGVMGEAFRHPDIAELMRKRLASAPFPQVIQSIIDRAAERGEMPPVTITPRAARLPFDLVRNETILNGETSRTAITELVDDVYLPLLRGLAAG